jgi:hypothetical protein
VDDYTFNKDNATTDAMDIGDVLYIIPQTTTGASKVTVSYQINNVSQPDATLTLPTGTSFEIGRSYRLKLKSIMDGTNIIFTWEL